MASTTTDRVRTEGLVTETVGSLPPPDTAVLAEALTSPTTHATHGALASRVAAFGVLEVRPAAGAPSEPPDGLVVAAWNAERLKYADASSGPVRSVRPDVLLLSETDVGLARSGNRHTTADLATSLGMGYAFGIEFLELGLGDARERAWHDGEANALGFHGNAILSRLPIRDPVLIRLDDGAVWWVDARADQRRLGWRMALAARVATATGPVLAVCVHLESKSDGPDRARQVSRLLDAVAGLAGDDPIVLGGDFNTTALPLTPRGDGWLDRPDADEPLFRLMAGTGFDWRAENTDGVTMRTRPDGTPRPPFRRIDWFFSRGLSVRAPATVPATGPDGVALSDHDLIRLHVSRP